MELSARVAGPRSNGGWLCLPGTRPGSTGAGITWPLSLVCMAGDAASVRLDCPVSVHALLSSLLLQLLEPGRRPASASPCDARELSAPGHHAALSHRHSPLHAHRLLGGGALLAHRLSPGVLSCLSGRQVPADSLPGSDYSRCGSATWCAPTPGKSSSATRA